MKKHISLDLETMGTKPYSAIIGIGAAYFDPLGTSITESFHVTIDLELAVKRGFRLDAGTVSWWLHPDRRDAWDRYMGVAHFSADDAFTGFQQWLDTVGDREDILVWGNGAGFDNALMHNAAEIVSAEWRTRDGETYPGFWPHWNDRCFRTMKSMTGTRWVVSHHTQEVSAKTLEPTFLGVPHVAVDDAMHQARWLQAICQEFNISF